MKSLHKCFLLCLGMTIIVPFASGAPEASGAKGSSIHKGEGASMSKSESHRDRHRDASVVLGDFWEIQNNHDYEALIDLFHEDAELVDPIYGTYRGREEVANFMTTMNEDMGRLGVTFELIALAAAGDTAWAKWHAVGPKGRRPGVGIYRVADGKIVYYEDNLVGPWDSGAPGLEEEMGEPPGQPTNPVAALWKMQEDGDYERLAELFADDAVLEDPLYGVKTGRESIAGFLREVSQAARASGSTFSLDDISTDGDTAWTRWTWKRPGKEDVSGVGLYRMENGRIVYYRDVISAAGELRSPRTE